MKNRLAEITSTINYLVEDMVFNKLFIYERNMQLIMFLLAWFSAKEIFFDGRKIRGWLDVLSFGESRAGKSAMAKELLRIFGTGAYVVCERASYAGLVGGVDKIQESNYARTGVFSLQDGGMVLLDEMQNMTPEEFGRLSDVRSDGVARITTIKTFTNQARCRKIWIANPRPNQNFTLIRFSSELEPVSLLKKLIPVFEDLTRFDIISGYTMTPLDVREKYIDVPKKKHIFTDKRMRAALYIAWERECEDIVFLPETTQKCRELARYMDKTFSSDFPMVIGAEQPDRLARLSAAAAALAPDNLEYGQKTLTVYPEHVEWVVAWLEELFKTDDLQYAKYASKYKERTDLAQNNRIEIVQKIRKEVVNYKQALFAISHSFYITSRQLKEEAPDVQNPETLVSGLYRAGLLRSTKDGRYIKTELMNSLLQEEFAGDISFGNIDSLKFGESQLF